MIKPASPIAPAVLGVSDQEYLGQLSCTLRAGLIFYHAAAGYLPPGR